MPDPRDTPPCDAEPGERAGAEIDRGMAVPAGIDVLAQVVPSSMPPGMFDDVAPPPSAPVIERPATPIPGMAALKRPSVRKMNAVKPPSVPQMSAVKPPSVPQMSAVKPPSVPQMNAVKPASLPKMNAVKPASLPKMNAVKPPSPPTVDAVQAAAVPQPSAPAEPAAAAPPEKTPSSFPSTEKRLVFEVASAPPERITPPPRSSLGALVVTQRVSSEGPIVVTPPNPWPATAESAAPNEASSAAIADAGAGPRGRSRVWPAVAAGAAMLLAVAVGASRLLHPVSAPATPGAPTAAAPGTTTPLVTPDPSPLAPEATAEPPPTAAAAPIPEEKGLLSTSTTAPGRRIFIDQRIVGETPAAVLVPCGLHQVRLGSRGKTTTLDIPCGGEVNVTDR